ncbi:DAK2 domain-containing protein [Clostridium sp. DL1XJH146]
MEQYRLNGNKLKDMLIHASNNLEKQKEYVNSLNVFPVPDGDTGTNMSMTFSSAVNEIKDKDTDNIGEIARLVSRGALMGARGNSGVILSQIFRGIAKGLEGFNEVDADQFSKAIEQGSKYAYKAVMRPTEGTILTIIRSAGEKAMEVEESNVTILMEKVCAYSEEVLNKTPDMLPALKEAKVVDAGGMGLLILFKGMLEVLKNDFTEIKYEENTSGEAKQDYSVQQRIDPATIKFGYCTEFFIRTEEAVSCADSFRETIAPMGDSIIVIGMEDIIKTHIHTNDPGWVLSQAVKYGELSKIKIDNMREEHRETLGINYSEEAKSLVEEEKEYSFVSVVMGEGLKDIFNDLGVKAVIEGGQTMNPSTQDLLEKIEKINAQNIFILPNNKNIIMAAEQAAEISEKNVFVIPTKTIPQGIAAITVFNEHSSVENNIENMKDIIEDVKTSSVTYAVRDTEFDGKQIKEGNILGLSEGKITCVGDDIYQVAKELIDEMTDEDSELISIYFGKDCDEDKVNDLVDSIEEKFDEIDVQNFNGKQPLYYFIISVE